MVGLLRGELFDGGQQTVGLLRGVGVWVKELLGGYLEVLADVEEAGEGRKHFPIFNFIDVCVALPQRETHIPRGDTLLHSKLNNPAPNHL